jgi:predicted nucleic acid-binding protein
MSGQTRTSCSSATCRATGRELARRYQHPTRLTSSLSDRVLLIDARVADRWGALNVPDPVPTVDGLLAATALVHDLVLVTRKGHRVG